MVPLGGLPDGMRYYCAVRDPDNPAVDVGNRLSQVGAEVTNIPGKLVIRLIVNFVIMLQLSDNIRDMPALLWE